MLRTPPALAVCCALALAAVATSPASAQLTRAEAVAAVTSEVPVTATSTMWCPPDDFGFGAGFEGLMPPGTVVEPALPDAVGWIGNAVTLAGEGYLFFHELDPGAAFVHEVQYIFVDATDPTPTLAEGSIAVQTQGSWPRITRPGFPTEDYFTLTGMRTDDPAGATNPDGLVATNLLPDNELILKTLLPDPPMPPGPRDARSTPPIPGTNPCAIVATGESDFNADVDAMTAAMTARGITGSRLQSQKNVTYDQFEQLIDNLCNQNPECDHCYVYFCSHGSTGSLQFADGSVPLMAPSDDPTADSICKLVEKLAEKCGTVELYIQACESGSLVEKLRPKLPKGVIITSAADGESSRFGTFRNADGDLVYPERVSLLMGQVIQCWGAVDGDNKPEADKPANGGDGDGKVSWAEAFDWVCKSPNDRSYRRSGGTDPNTGEPNLEENTRSKVPQPSKTGLPDKRVEFCVGGAEYRIIKEDLDQDGQFDLCTFFIDFNKDGTNDQLYIIQDRDEDGNPNSSLCIADQNGNGITDVGDTRVDIEDADDDGTPEEVRRSVWDGNDWVPQQQAPPRPEEAEAQQSAVPQTGNQPVGLVAQLPIFEPTAAYRVFIGPYECPQVFFESPTQLLCVTPLAPVGVYDVYIVDFDQFSPTHGFVQIPDALELVPALPLPDRMIPGAPLMCGGQPDPVLLLGDGFLGPPLDVLVDGQPVPFTIIDDTTIELMPPIACDGVFDVAVVELNNGDPFVLIDALRYLPLPDPTPPTLLPPDPIAVPAPPPAFTAPLPPAWNGVAEFDGLPLPVQPDVFGGLPLGVTAVNFHARNQNGVRAVGTSDITVNPDCPTDLNNDGFTDLTDLLQVLANFGGGAGGDINGDGVTDLTDLLAVLAEFGNPCGPPTP